MRPFILLENRKLPIDEPGSWIFENPIEEIICTDPRYLTSSLDYIDEKKRAGYYLVGFLSFECGYYIEPWILDFECTHNFPLLHFLVFNSPQRCTQKKINSWLKNKIQDTQLPVIHNMASTVNEAQYRVAFDQIRKHLLQGDTYQTNYTLKYKFELQGCAIKLYQIIRERQKVSFGGFLNLGEYQILSFSPELFFLKQGQDIMVKPMKGTMPRGLTQEQDEKNRYSLTTVPKLIAENIIIVDLLRNDLSTMVLPGSLTVKNLLQVETFETLHQMTSTIAGKVERDISLKTIVHNLFPCGSVTGAPKRRTMQIIHALEKEPRHVYTGAIGYITPHNDMCFNVAIRTILLRQGRGELGVGGGVVYDSMVSEEFAELKLKAQFFTGLWTHL